MRTKAPRRPKQQATGGMVAPCLPSLSSTQLGLLSHYGVSGRSVAVCFISLARNQTTRAMGADMSSRPIANNGQLNQCGNTFLTASVP
jgi:hypothetical protein